MSWRAKAAAKMDAMKKAAEAAMEEMSDKATLAAAQVRAIASADVATRKLPSAAKQMLHYCCAA